MSETEPVATEAQQAFTAAQARLAAVEREVRELSWKLPPLTGAVVANAKTAWRSTPAQIVEGGYMRWTDLENTAAEVPETDWQYEVANGSTSLDYDEWLAAQQVDGNYTTVTEPQWHASTDGWDDMSEDGAYEFVEVDGLPYKVPDDLDYD